VTASSFSLWMSTISLLDKRGSQISLLLELVNDLSQYSSMPRRKQQVGEIQDCVVNDLSFRHSGILYHLHERQVNKEVSG
jgi:hypothetical protein